MKKNTFLTFILVILAFGLSAQTSTNSDVILKMNGDEMIGKVTEIGDIDIKFTYKGESLPYVVKKSEVVKITFASGRIEYFNNPPAAQDSVSHKASGRNMIAILPFGYLIDKQNASMEMIYNVQSECYRILKGHTGGLTLQDPTETDAVLLKAGLTQDNYKMFHMGEICTMLGVEFVINGVVTQDMTSVTNYGSSSSKTQSANKKGTQTSTYSSNSSTQQYSTSVTMNVYNDKGENIFSKDHMSFWSTNDAYKITLEYLLKRTPLYKK